MGFPPPGEGLRMVVGGCGRTVSVRMVVVDGGASSFYLSVVGFWGDADETVSAY